VVLQGEVPPIVALVKHPRQLRLTSRARVSGVLHVAADNAARRLVLLAAGDTPEACWRFGIPQTLDDYSSTLLRGGTTFVAQVFAAEPAPTGAVQLDAAFAAGKYQHPGCQFELRDPLTGLILG
jgi:hypothetical protein